VLLRTGAAPAGLRLRDRIRRAQPAPAAVPRTRRHVLGTQGRDAALRDWLTHAQSLTARISAACQRFEVRVLRSGRDRLLPQEARLLGTARRCCHIREVLLLADGVPVVWARTVLEPEALRGPWYFLGRLGTRPLGARLFSDPAIARSRFVFLTGYRPASRMRLPAALPAYPLPARLARLARHGHHALLTEALLPALTRLPYP